MKKALERMRLTPQRGQRHTEWRTVEDSNEQLQKAVEATDWSQVELPPQRRRRAPT